MVSSFGICALESILPTASDMSGTSPTTSGTPASTIRLSCASPFSRSCKRCDSSLIGVRSALSAPYTNQNRKSSAKTMVTRGSCVSVASTCALPITPGLVKKRPEASPVTSPALTRAIEARRATVIGSSRAGCVRGSGARTPKPALALAPITCTCAYNVAGSTPGVASRARLTGIAAGTATNSATNESASASADKPRIPNRWLCSFMLDPLRAEARALAPSDLQPNVRVEHFA